jgi:homoserine dehydrogenase
LRRAGLGLLGFGTVGRALANLVVEDRSRLERDVGVHFALVAVGNRGVARKRAEWSGGAPPRFTEDLESVVDDPDVSIVVELLGGLEPAGALVARALAAGKSVVTANKLLLAERGSELAALARMHGAGLGVEASVAGGIPILRALRESLAGDALLSVGGILNGTCNFILSGMEKTGRSYAEMLADAQRLGYAEADPSADVLGGDAACKLTLLARMAFGQEVALRDVAKEGITHLMPCDFVYAKALGRTLKQLATCAALPDGRLLLGVRTHLVAGHALLAKLEGPFNAVRVVARRAGELVFTGRGAGGDPTAVAVLSDVLELARAVRPEVPPFGFESLAPRRLAGPEDFVAPFALRFVVRDRPGIIAEIARCLAEHEVNIDAVLQEPFGEKSALPFVMTVEPIAEARLLGALQAIRELPFHAEEPAAFPMTS